MVHDTRQGDGERERESERETVTGTGRAREKERDRGGEKNTERFCLLLNILVHMQTPVFVCNVPYNVHTRMQTTDAQPYI